MDVVEGADASGTLSGNAQPGYVYLNWEFPDTIGGYTDMGAYYVYKGTSPQKVDQQVTQTIELSYSDNDVSAGVTYYYLVTALYRDGTNTIPYSTNQISVTEPTVPDAPVGLTAYPEDGKMWLMWFAPTDDGGAPIVYYNLYYKQGNGAWSSPVYVDGTSYTLTGLQNGQVYQFSVTAVNPMGEGKPSSMVSGVPGQFKIYPTPPTSMTATAGDGKVTLTWKPPADNGGKTITKYGLFWAEDPQYLNPPLDVGHEPVYAIMVDGTSYVHTGLQNGKTYYYLVNAQTSEGFFGDYSTMVSATPKAASVPMAPTNLVATPGDGLVKLTWKAPSSGGSTIDHYVVYQNGIAVTTVTGTTKTMTGLTNGVSYNFAVAAHNVTGEGPQSKAVSATPSAQVGVPSAPIELNATAAGLSVQLTWSGPSNDGGSAITGYRLYWSKDASAPFSSVDVAEPFFMHEGLESGGTYYYKVSAINQAGEGALSEMVNATVLDPSLLPSAPTNLIADTAGDSIELTWNEPVDDGGSPIVEYAVYRGVDSDNLTKIATVVDTMFVDTATSDDIEYFYQVTAKNSKGLGESSDVVTASMGSAATDKGVPVEYLAIAGVVGAAAVGTSALVLRRRKAP